MNNVQKRKIIIDTDPGHDDVLALLLLLKADLFDVQAITTVAGNSTIENVTRNTAAVLDLINSHIPVYSGARDPLNRKLIPAVVHGESGLDGYDTSSTPFQLTGDAPQRIVEIIRKFPNEVTILTLGPLSNLARAIQLDPELPQLISQVVMMGGAINVPGNKNRVAEFNFFVDPEAADLVFKSHMPKVLTPLDACNDVVFQLNDFSTMAESKIKSAILPMMKSFIQGLIADEGTDGILVYDALAAYFLINPEACQLSQMDIVIETQGEHTAGMTVAEKRSSKDKVLNVKVIQAIDQKKFRADFIRILQL